MFAVIIAERPWLKGHYDGDTVLCFVFVLNAFLAVHDTQEFIPFLNDVQTDRHFLGNVRTVCTVSDAPKLEKAVKRKTRPWPSSSNAPFVMNTGPIQVI
jgi:hypothetical protein